MSLNMTNDQYEPHTPPATPPLQTPKTPDLEKGLGKTVVFTSTDDDPIPMEVEGEDYYDHLK
jgi:hypothetical protein